MLNNVEDLGSILKIGGIREHMHSECLLLRIPYPFYNLIFKKVKDQPSSPHIDFGTFFFGKPDKPNRKDLNMQTWSISNKFLKFLP